MPRAGPGSGRRAKERPWSRCADLLPPLDLVDGAVRERNHEEVAVGSTLDVRDHPEVRADEQALALRHVVEVEVVRHAIGQSGVVNRDLPAVAGQVEDEERAALRLRYGEAHE